MKYKLMNKDNEILEFDINYIDNKTICKVNKLLTDEKNLPYGIRYTNNDLNSINIKSWLANRKSYTHNNTMKEIMETLQCVSDTDFIKYTHGTSINDTFWVKEISENIKFSNISLYINNFNDIISYASFENINNDELKTLINERTISPELIVGGSFKKCFRRIDNNIYLYKRGLSVKLGSKDVYNNDTIYNEILASELVSKICNNSVKYNLKYLHNNLASECELFTNEKIGFVPISLTKEYISEISNNSSYKAFCNITKKYNVLEKFKLMNVIDSLIFNVDRHEANWGFIFNNDTNEILDFAPLFDFNLSFFARTNFEDLKNEKFNENDIFSAIEKMNLSDFAKVNLTDNNKKILKQIKGFEFTIFNGNTEYPKERIVLLQKLIDKQISSILDEKYIFLNNIKNKNLER